MTHHPTALSVNLNKVALVRNTRHLGIPSVTRAATLCLQAGASGITVHPRPDARHIRAGDVSDLAQLMQAWPDREFNIEGNPFHNLMDVVVGLVARKLPVFWKFSTPIKLYLSLLISPRPPETVKICLSAPPCWVLP